MPALLQIGGSGRYTGQTPREGESAVEDYLGDQVIRGLQYLWDNATRGRPDRPGLRFPVIVPPTPPAVPPVEPVPVAETPAAPEVITPEDAPPQRPPVPVPVDDPRDGRIRIGPELGESQNQVYPVWPIPVTESMIERFLGLAENEAAQRILGGLLDEFAVGVRAVPAGPGAVVELLFNPTELGHGDTYTPPPPPDPAGAFGGRPTPVAGGQSVELQQPDDQSTRDP